MEAWTKTRMSLLNSPMTNTPMRRLRPKIPLGDCLRSEIVVTVKMRSRIAIKLECYLFQLPPSISCSVSISIGGYSEWMIRWQFAHKIARSFSEVFVPSANSESGLR